MAEDDFDPTGMTIQQVQAAGHDVSLPSTPPPSQPQAQTPGPPDQQEFDPTGMTIDQLQSAGVSVSAPQQNQPAGPPAEGAVASLTRAAAHSALPFAASLPGMIAGGEAGFEAGLGVAPFLGPLAPVAPPAGALIGGAIGGMIPGAIAGKVQESALDAAGLNDEAQRRANEAAHPIMTAVGEFLPAAVTFDIGDVTTRLAQRLLLGGGMGALDIAQQKLRGEKDINYAEALTQAAGGALFTTPRKFVEPMAQAWAKAGRQAGAMIPGVEAGRAFMNKTYPPGRPDLSDYNGATDFNSDKNAVQQVIPATPPGKNNAASPPPPRPTPPNQPSTGFEVEASAGNKERQFKPELQPQAPAEGHPSTPLNMARSPAEDPTIAAAMEQAGAGTTPPEEVPTKFGPQLDAQFPRRPQQPTPPSENENPAAGMAPLPPTPEPQPVRQTGLSPEDREAIQRRSLPFDEQLKLLQSDRAANQQPPATEQAIATSKNRPKLGLPQKQAPEEAAGALNAKPVEQTTPQNPEDAFAGLTKALSPNATPEPVKPRPGRFTNMEVSDKTIKALRATGNPAHAELADKLDALPPGHDREHEAARVWAAMHSQTGEVPTVLKSVRVRNPEVLDKLQVKGYINPKTGKPVRTGTVPNAIMYSKIHEINDRLLDKPELQPQPNETEEQVKARAQNILDTAKIEAKAEAARMMEEARRPGSNLTDKDKNHLIAAATQLGNGKLPVENYAMNKLMKPPAWRLQRMAKDLVEGKIPPDYVEQTAADGTKQEIISAEPWEKFLANERLVRGSPEDYATFVRNNIAEAETAKKTKPASDLAYAEEKQAARQVAAGRTNEQAEPGTALARPQTEETDETLGDRLKRERYEDRILDKMRSMKYDAGADKLEAMPLGDARDNAFKTIEARLLKMKQQPMLRSQMPPVKAKGFQLSTENRLKNKLEEKFGRQTDEFWNSPKWTEIMKEMATGESPIAQKHIADLIALREGQPVQQGMARKKMPRPADSLGYDQLNDKILEAAYNKVRENEPPPPEPPKEGEGGGKPPPEPPPVAVEKYGQDLEDRLLKMEASVKNSDQQLEQIAERLGKTRPELNARELYEARTPEELASLPEPLRQSYEAALKPMEDVVNRMFDNLREVAPDEVGPKVKDHLSRILMNGDEGGSIDKYASGRSDDPMLGRNLKPATTGTLKPRAFYALEYADGPSQGASQVISPNELEKGYTIWNDHKGTKVTDPNFEFKEDGTYTDPNGQKYIMKQATEDQIENNALLENGQPPLYARNRPLSVLKAFSDAMRFGLRHQFFTSLKSDKVFQAYSTTDPKIAADKGWIKTNMPTFAHYYMEPKLAHVLDDYYKPGFHDLAIDPIRQLNQAVTKTIYLFPTVHALNVAGFGFVQRGFEWLKPRAYATLMDTGTKAIKSVLQQDDLQKDLRDSGLILMSGFNHDFMQGLGKALGMEIKRNPRQFELLGKILGVNAQKFVKTVYDKSSHAMWTASDVIVTQAVLEREAQGMSRPEAIRAVEQIIPNYRIGTQFLTNGNFGRFAAKLFADPATMAFGPYHVGVIRAFGNMLRNALKGTPDERMQAAGQLTMMAVLAFAVKPVFDKFSQLVTGNQNAEIRPMGPLTIPTNLVRAGLGEKDISAALRDTFTIPPLMSTAGDLLRNQNFAGRPIVQPEDIKRAAHGSPTSAARAAVSAAEFAARGTIAPLNIAMGAVNGNNEGLLGAARDQLLGIHNPTPQEVRFQRLKPKYDQRALKQEKKTEKDPVKQLFDSLTR